MRKILCFFQGSLESPSALENNFFNIFDFCDNSSLSKKNVILKIIDAKAEPALFQASPPITSSRGRSIKITQESSNKKFLFWWSWF